MEKSDNKPIHKYTLSGSLHSLLHSLSHIPYFLYFITLFFHICKWNQVLAHVFWPHLICMLHNTEENKGTVAERYA